MSGRGWSAYHVGEISERTGAVIDALDEFPDGCRAENVYEVVGISKKDAATYLARIVRYGYAERVGRGLYRPAEAAEEEDA